MQSYAHLRPSDPSIQGRVRVLGLARRLYILLFQSMQDARRKQDSRKTG